MLIKNSSLSPKVLGIIGARGGSKRLPNKNILPLCGVPLLAWTIKPALSSEAFTRLIVSTDCEEIAKIAKESGAEVPYLRSKLLATDEASSVDFVLDALEYYVSNGESFDYVMLLQPTSPLRSKEDIIGIVNLARNNHSIQSFVSVCEAEHSPLWCTKLDKDNLIDGFIGEASTTKRSQDLDSYFRLNGAMYLIKVEALIEENKFYLSGKTMGYVMPKQRSVDIDDIWDFKIAETLIGSV